MKKFSIELKWGVLFSCVLLAWMSLEKFLGWHDKLIEKHALLTNLFAFPAVLMYILALRDKRENFYDGRISWIRAFATGVLISLVIAALNPLIQYLTLKYISPEYLSNAMEYAISAEKTTAYQAKQDFTMGNYMIQGVLGSIALGTVTSAIVAIFIRKK